MTLEKGQIPLNKRQMEQLGFTKYIKGFASKALCGQIGIHNPLGTMMKKIPDTKFKEILGLVCPNG